jgi:hypothetical protein
MLMAGDAAGEVQDFLGVSTTGKVPNFLVVGMIKSQLLFRHD